MTDPPMITRDDLSRAICCEAGDCRHPEDCRRNKATLVWVPTAVAAVSALLCRRWREWPRNDGPMVVTRAIRGRDE